MSFLTILIIISLATKTIKAETFIVVKLSSWELKSAECHQGNLTECSMSLRVIGKPVNGSKMKLNGTLMYGAVWSVPPRVDKMICPKELGASGQKYKTEYERSALYSFKKCECPFVILYNFYPDYNESALNDKDDDLKLTPENPTLEKVKQEVQNPQVLLKKKKLATKDFPISLEFIVYHRHSEDPNYTFTEIVKTEELVYLNPKSGSYRLNKCSLKCEKCTVAKINFQVAWFQDGSVKPTEKCPRSFA